MRQFAFPTALIAMLFGMPNAAAAASIILNGSFENNTATASVFNMTNATFNATVADATAFGDSVGVVAGQFGEIDLVTSTDFGIAPQDGDWKLGLHVQNTGGRDAFSMSLTEGIIGGSTYNLQFYGALLTTTGTVEVGFSSNATSFGTLVFSGSPASAASWTLFNALIVAPSNASFLTVRVTDPNGYTFVDNFTLESTSAVPEPATLSLFGVGAAAAALRRRRVRTRAVR